MTIITVKTILIAFPSSSVVGGMSNTALLTSSVWGSNQGVVSERWRHAEYWSDLQASENLVDEELDMVIGQLLTLDDVVEVRAHQVGHQVPETPNRRSDCFLH